MIYFIENAGLIKVGYAWNVEKRFDALKTTALNLRVLATMEGNRRHERAIHNRLAEYRHAREGSPIACSCGPSRMCWKTVLKNGRAASGREITVRLSGTKEASD